MKPLKNPAQAGFVQAYLRIIGFITLFLGIALLFWPAEVGTVFFNHIGAEAGFFARITGSTLIGYSVLNMLASLDKNRHLQETAVWGNLSTLAVASAITASYYGKFDSYGWLIISQHIFFAGGFIICLLKLKRR